jgi:uncharacterized repeat protein (TIGR03803 family)
MFRIPGSCVSIICAFTLLVPVGGASAATVLTLHNFDSPNQGYHPDGDLLVDQSGNIYGTTTFGGNFDNQCTADGCGTVYRLAPDGTVTVLHTFTGSPDGEIPTPGLIGDQAGNLYGVTWYGGAVYNKCPSGCGTVFKLAPDGTETVLYAFHGSGGDGRIPSGDLLLDQAGNLYGVTASGGNFDCGSCGMAFKLAPDGTETVLHVFKGGNDGAYPPEFGSAGLIADQSGNLYGVTSAGGGGGCFGGGGCGTVFKLAPDGTETILHSFQGGRHDGALPEGGLTIDAAGNLYGTTWNGGFIGPRHCDNNGYDDGCGTVFELSPNGKIKILYAFRGSDGAFPVGRLVFDQVGDIFGSTVEGGHGYRRQTGNPNCDNSLLEDGGCGTAFEITPDGSETVLYAMSSKHGGQVPFAGLAMDQSGNIYGTTSEGGDATCNNDCGTVFEIIP